MKHCVIYEHICFLPYTKIQSSPQAAGNLPKEIKQIILHLFIDNKHFKQTMNHGVSTPDSH